MKRIARSLSEAVAVAAVASLAAGCGTTSGTASDTVKSSPSEPVQAAHTGFVGYKWSVVAISHHGRNTAIPARYAVFLWFPRSGQFVANEPVNTHSGSYRVTGAGFSTTSVVVSAAGYVGHDPITLLSVSAISSFDTPAHATASVTGNWLTVTVDGYTLICLRDGVQEN